jgi:Carboxypeptidase regulatory-like domain/TonB dependent receptor
MLRTLRASALFLFIILLVSASLLAQVDKAVLVAVALDQSKSPLAGVTVTLTRPEVGLSSVQVTDSRGTARFVSLTPGTYELSFALEGFAPVAQRGVVLRVGQTATINAVLQARSSESITVTAAAPIVDVHKTDSSTNIVPEQIQSLPVPDRDFQRLAFITPGVERERGAFRFINGGPVIGAGGNASQSTILVNGVDFTDPALGLARTRFSQDAIREFRVIADRFDTEIGGSSGGALSIVTKSGTNDLKGTVFGFFRDKSLQAKGALDQQKNDYSRHQLGFTLGGPAVRDRLFYFGSLEQIHEKNIVLFRPGGKYASTAADLSHPFDQTLAFGSMDDQVSPSQSVGARLVYEKYSEDNFRVGGVADQSYGQQLNRNNWNASFEHNWLVSPKASNEARLQVGGRKYSEPTNSKTVAEWFSSGNTLQTGGNILGDLLGQGSNWEVRDTVYYHAVAGRSTHDFKGGFSAEHVHDRSRITTYQYGLFLYLTDDRSIPLAYAYGVGSADVTASTNLYGAFLEDAWRPMANLVVNLGLRYDLDTNGNDPGFHHPLVPNGRKRDTNNYQPRVSASYDLFSTGSYVIRGGAGKFTGRFLLVPLFTELQQNGVTGRTTYTRVNGALFGIPSLALDPKNPTTTGIVSKPAIALLSPDLVSPESTQASLGWTTRLGASRTYFDTEGIYVHGTNEITIRDVNFAGNSNPTRPNKNYDQINMYTNDGHSKYTALVLSLNGSVRQNDILTSSVTFANKKNISDDFSPEFPTGYPNDPSDIAAEYGRARGWERYRIVLSGVFHLPWAMTVAPIFEYGSGQPWTHRLGYDFNGDGKNSDRPAGVARFGEDGPLFRQLSLRLTKSIPVSSAFGGLDLIAEAFNLTNVRNFDVASVDGAQYLSGPTLANSKLAYVVNPSFGQYRATLPPRQIQLGVRWAF